MDQENPEKKTLKEVTNLIDEDRVLNFSDGVFAFAATLLVIKLELPSLAQSEITSPRLTQEIINLWPQYFANIISFLMIGYYWLTHHAIFSLIRKITPHIIWLNLFFLIFLSFLPFPVDLFGDFNNSDIIVIFYSLSLALAGSLLASIWFYSVKTKLILDSLSKRQIAYYSCRFALAPLVFALSIPLVYIDIAVAKISWLFVILGVIIINRIFKYKRLSAIEKQSI